MKRLLHKLKKQSQWLFGKSKLLLITILLLACSFGAKAQMNNISITRNYQNAGTRCDMVIEFNLNWVDGGMSILYGVNDGIWTNWISSVSVIVDGYALTDIRNSSLYNVLNIWSPQAATLFRNGSRVTVTLYNIGNEGPGSYNWSGLTSSGQNAYNPPPIVNYATPISPPINSPSSITSNGFCISWNPVSSGNVYIPDATTFKYFVNRVPDGASIIGMTEVGLANSTCISGLQPNTTYTFYVAGFNQYGGGQWSFLNVTTANQVPQTITFLPNPLPDKTYGDIDFLVSATASSNLPVTFTSSDATIASVTSGGTVSIKAAGQVNIYANQSGNGSYLPATQVTRVLKILPKPVTVNISGATANNKIYNGNTDATYAGAMLVGKVGSDDVTLVQSGTFADKNVANGISIVPNMSLAGAKAANYTLIQPVISASANITPKELTVSGATAQNKTYDTNTSAVISGATLVGRVGTDDVVLATATSGTFASQNAANGISVTSAMTLTGTAKDNYYLTQPTLSANITQKELTVSGAVAQNKIYDSTTDAIISGATLVGVLNSEDVLLATETSGTFAGPNVANGINVVPAMTITGAGIANYSLTQPTLSANITQKELTVSGATADNKVYDSNTNATFAGASLVGVFNGDIADVSLSKVGQFDDPNIGTGIPVTPNMSISGTKSGNYYLTQPANSAADITPKELTVSGAVASNKIYDGNTNATVYGATLVGVIGSEDVVLEDKTTGVFDSPDVANNINVTTAMTLSGTASGNYSLSQPTLSANITQKELTVTGALANNKIYDGTTNATYSGASLVGVVGTDNVVLVPNGIFASKNVGNGIGVNPTMSLSGTKAPNYSITQPVLSSTANILPKELTVINVAVQNKTYDQNANAVILGATVSGVVGSEDVTLVNYSSGAFDNPNAGSNKSVSTSMTIVGTAIGNYSLTQPVLKGNILQVMLQITKVATESKVYDGTTVANVGGANLVGVLPGDWVFAETGTGDFEDSKAGTSKKVNTNGFILKGTHASNYSIAAQPEAEPADITPAQVTIEGVKAQSKIYDASIEATLSGGTLKGIIGSDMVGINYGTGAFQDKNAGTGKSVTAMGYALTGADAGNYKLMGQPSVPAADITKANVSIEGVTAVEKVYDSTTRAILTGGKLSGVLKSDDVKISEGTGAFNDKNIGTGKPVSAVGYTLSGSDAVNYNLTGQPAGMTASITAAKVTLIGIKAENKVYDAKTAAKLSEGTITGIKGSDDVKIIPGTGVFSDKNVGTGKTVTAQGYTLSGADAGNYVIEAQPAGLSAEIIAAPLSISGVQAQNKIYDGSINATLTGGLFDNVIQGDDVKIVAGIGTFSDKNKGTGKLVTAAGYNLSGADSGNYKLSDQPSGLKADITAAEAVVSGVKALNKVYDGTTVATLEGGTLTGTLSGDAISLVIGTGSFNDKNAGTGKSVAAIGYALTGTDAGNYNLKEQPTGLKADITKANLIVKADDKSKTYGSPNPDFTVNYSGFIGDDSPLAISSMSITCQAGPTSKAGTYPIVSSGGNAQNYNLIHNNGTLTVNKAKLKIAATSKSRLFGETNPELTISYSGFVNGDSESALTQKPGISVSATTSSLPGNYPIIVTGGASENYSFEYENGILEVRAFSGDKNGDGKISFPEEKVGDKNGDGKITHPEEVAGDKDGDGKITPPKEVAGDVDGDGKITRPTEVAGDLDGDGKITSPKEVAGDLDGDGKITPPKEVAGDLDGDGKITSPLEVLGDVDGDGKITRPKETAGDKNGDGKINWPDEVAGDKDGDGKITSPEITGDLDGDGKITLPELAGDRNGDGKITYPEIAGDKNGDGKIIAPEIAGDRDGDGKITFPGEVAGDVNGDGKITTPEIAGDLNGDGIITAPEIAGDRDGDGKITPPEIAGDINGDGVINGDEIAGDTNGDGRIGGNEVAGDTDGNGRIDGNEIAGDLNGDGKMSDKEIMGDTDGNGKIEGNEIAGDRNGDHKIDSAEVRLPDPAKDHKNINHLFSPNSDGINDYWKVPGIEELGRVHVKIYDRWGSIVYESTNYQNDWEGTLKGNPVPEGTYFYFIKSDKGETLKGEINIVR